MDDSSETARTNTNNNSSPSNGSQQLARSLEERKKGLKLDFSSPESTKKSLTTPDIINLNVEAFIKSLTAARTPEGLTVVNVGNTPILNPSQYLTVNGTTPTVTPTQFLCPKNVTAEQEQYARGFIDALNTIYKAEKFVPPAPSLLSPGFVAQTVVGGVVVTEANGVAPGGNGLPKSSTNPSAVQSHSDLSKVNDSTTTVAPLVNNSNTRTTLILTIQDSGGEPKLQKVTEVTNAKLLANPSLSYTTTSDAVNSFLKMQQQQTGGVFPIPFTTANSGGIPYPLQMSQLFNSSGLNGSNAPGHNTLLHFPQGTVQVKPEPQEEVHSGLSDQSTTYPSSQHSSPRPPQFSVVAGKFPARNVATATPPMTAGNYRNSPAPTAALQPAAINTYTNLTVVQPSQQQQESLANSESCGDEDDSSDDGGGDSRSVSSASGSPYFGRSSALKREFCELEVGHPLPPAVQEALKLERKRERNRLAATKCRARKIQRIEQLEIEVNGVKSRNSNLASKADSLRREVAELRRLLAAHNSRGCKVPLDVSCTAAGR